LEELEKWIEGEAEIPLNVRSILRQVSVEEITDEDEDLFIKAKASVLRSHSNDIGSEGLRPQLVCCAPFPSIAPYFRIL